MMVFRVNPFIPRLFQVSRLTARRFQSTLDASLVQLKELHPSLLQKAESYCDELDKLKKDMFDGNAFDVEQQKKYARFSTIADAFHEYKSQLDDYKGLNEMIKSDPALKDEASQELEQLIPLLNRSSSVLLDKLLPPHEFADKPCIIELRPGVGGIEAMIFAQDLLNMYIGYATSKKWKHEIISRNENESGSGIVDAILSINEPGAYDRMRLEVGVHRVQRVPATETKGRTHTSTAAVVVLPQLGNGSEREAEAYERTFKPDEIRIDVMRARGKGGQHVNTTDSAVRLTHFPSGIVISMQDERSQHKNKAKAFAILKSKLAEIERLEKEEKERSARKEQVSTTDRSDKIRTYNYPQNRITDHRCGLTLYALNEVITGERLDEVMDVVKAHDTDERSQRLLNEQPN
ncbi:hypothetical protein Kpol_534p13 [Vanderwaltozyma polyspora DSM 70294]|uniref:Peptide chain release factor 1, mitochondrial n=1 Tax=Vanderwaltozyma polyspora (strain ATCC 22028 / DSM 70294 / BCRC 21397 / CBS 2163 / NBRC 10782 / NRRL Y-8283 / UCD 57-17) TaxID=436907 RepID=A7TJJ1_VANPO|nr:uncharacterized protein Kpol_534p13 [Vanderwaltozyma polyspora DSM 70294]EDO17534.1 hypothetical protein Kpol_534p13 [Vanderwaltozyma polyspora DSM 70294]